MLVLYHLPLVPACRKIRLALAEKGVAFQLKAEKIWERRPAFLALNPAGDVPVVEVDGRAVSGANAVAEYLEEAYPDPPLIPGDAAMRAEVRRLVDWFDIKFDREVTENLVGEKVMRRFLGRGQPDTQAIRAGRHNITIHLDYIAWLADRRSWLAGDALTYADLAAAAHLSCVDYLGDVPWQHNPGAKDWYARIKSRPSFRPLLIDKIAGLPPPRHYTDLDF